MLEATDDSFCINIGVEWFIFVLENMAWISFFYQTYWMIRNFKYKSKLNIL